MLREWLSPQPVEVFLQKHLGRSPCARPTAAASLVSLLDWNVFGHMLELQPPDVLVVCWGQLAKIEPPRSLPSARHLLRQRLGIVVRQVEQLAESFADVGRRLARDVPGDVHVHVHATPAGTHALGWHFEPDDAFIVQTVGVREYYFRDNTVSPLVPGEEAPDFGAIRHETSCLFSTKLLPGDVLYLPRRWWRLVRSLDDALSIAIAIAPCSDVPLESHSDHRAGCEEAAVAKL